MKHFVLLMVFFLGTAHFVEAAGRASTFMTIHGESYPIESLAHNHPVYLQGVGAFKLWGKVVYTAAFYSGAAQGPAQTAELYRYPKKLVLWYHRPIRRQDVIRAAEHHLKNNPDVNYPAIKERVELLAKHYSSKRAGDRAILVYSQQKGTEFLINEVSKVVIPGEDFARAYFGIWISDRPIDRKLRDGLLGIKP